MRMASRNMRMASAFEHGDFSPFLKLALYKCNIIYYSKGGNSFDLHYFIWYFDPIESIKTTSMEDVSTGVLEKNKEYLRGKDKAPKMIWCNKTYIIAYVKLQKIRYTIHYVTPTAQLLLKNWFPKGGPTCRRQVVNPRHQTPQGQSVAKPEFPLQNIQVE